MYGAFVQNPKRNCVDQVLPIIATYQHVMHTGSLDFARMVFDDLVANNSNIDHISATSGLVEGVAALVDWPSGMMDVCWHPAAYIA